MCYGLSIFLTIFKLKISEKVPNMRRFAPHLLKRYRYIKKSDVNRLSIAAISASRGKIMAKRGQETLFLKNR